MGSYLHVARLRYALSCVRLASKEIWALAHWERSWLCQLDESVQWMWELTDAGESHATHYAAWEAWTAEAKTQPGRWKSRVRRAQSRALRKNLWHAAEQQHSGLLFRQLRRAGARVPQDLLQTEVGNEVCAVCRLHFADYRAWSVHAFKTHARVDEVRRLASGSQCPTCLRHYPTPVQLCRHLRHSRACRQPLLSRGGWSEPEPGQGSRKAVDKGLHCAPGPNVGQAEPAQV